MERGIREREAFIDSWSGGRGNRRFHGGAWRRSHRGCLGLHAHARGGVLDKAGKAELAVGHRVVVVGALASGRSAGGSVLETLVGAAGTSEGAGAVGGHFVVPSGASFAGVPAVANVTDTDVTRAAAGHVRVIMAVALADRAGLVQSAVACGRTAWTWCCTGSSWPCHRHHSWNRSTQQHTAGTDPR